MRRATRSSSRPASTPHNKCNAIYPVHSEPRLVAGAPLTNDVMKCQLKPINFADYKATFTDAQKARDEDACSPPASATSRKPGVAQVPDQGHLPEILGS